MSLTSPALVEAVSGLRYVIVFAGAFAITNIKPSWFREDFSRWVLVTKVAATALVVAGLVITGLGGGNVSAGPQ